MIHKNLSELKNHYTFISEEKLIINVCVFHDIYLTFIHTQAHTFVNKTKVTAYLYLIIANLINNKTIILPIKSPSKSNIT